MATNSTKKMSITEKPKSSSSAVRSLRVSSRKSSNRTSAAVSRETKKQSSPSEQVLKSDANEYFDYLMEQMHNAAMVLELSTEPALESLPDSFVKNSEIIFETKVEENKEK